MRLDAGLDTPFTSLGSLLLKLQGQLENADLHCLGISPLTSVGQIAVSIAQMYYSSCNLEGFVFSGVGKIEVNQQCTCLRGQVPSPSRDHLEMLACRCLVVQDSFPCQPKGPDSLLMGI